MKVIVGSSDLQLTVSMVSMVASIFSATPEGEAFGVRVSYEETSAASPVERLVETVGIRTNRAVIRYSPTRGGRAAVFHRDYHLVEGASEVLAFFSPEREMDGGTGHVVKAALDRGVKVDAYSVHPDGTLVYLGSDEADPMRWAGPNEILAKMYEEALEA
jgi:hypothetical protein